MDSALQCKAEYDEKLIQAEAKKKEREDELKKQMEEAANNNENKDNPDNANNPIVPQEVEEEKVDLVDFQKLPKKYILCMDTLGQDRVFSKEEEAFAFDVAKTLRNSWEELEKSLLIKDRDIRIEMIKNEKLYLEQVY